MRIVPYFFDAYRRVFQNPIMLARSLRVAQSVQGYALERNAVFCTSFENTALTAFTGLAGQTALLTFGLDITQVNNFSIYAINIIPRTLPVGPEQYALNIYQGQSAVAGGVDATSFNLLTSANSAAIVGHFKNTGVVGTNLTLTFPVISGIVTPTNIIETQNNFNPWNRGLSGKTTDGNKIICIGSPFTTTGTFDISVIWGYDSST